MLDFGFSEILLTSAIALVVLGPERLPKVARQVGNWMGRARAMARQLSEQLEREVSAEELMKPKSSANRLAAPTHDGPRYTAPPVAPQYALPDVHAPLPEPHAEYEPSADTLSHSSAPAPLPDADAAAHGEPTPPLGHATGPADAGRGAQVLDTRNPPHE